MAPKTATLSDGSRVVMDLLESVYPRIEEVGDPAECRRILAALPPLESVEVTVDRRPDTFHGFFSLSGHLYPPATEARSRAAAALRESLGSAAVPSVAANRGPRP